MEMYIQPMKMHQNRKQYTYIRIRIRMYVYCFLFWCIFIGCIYISTISSSMYVRIRTYVRMMASKHDVH